MSVGREIKSPVRPNSPPIEIRKIEAAAKVFGLQEVQKPAQSLSSASDDDEDDRDLKDGKQNEKEKGLCFFSSLI